MPEEPNYAETYLSMRRGIVAGYYVPLSVGQDLTTGEPNYIFHKAAAATFAGDAAGEFAAWQWLHGVAAGYGRELGERSARVSPLWGPTVSAQAVTVAGVPA